MNHAQVLQWLDVNVHSSNPGDQTESDKQVTSTSRNLKFWENLGNELNDTGKDQTQEEEKVELTIEDINRNIPDEVLAILSHSFNKYWHHKKSVHTNIVNQIVWGAVSASKQRFHINIYKCI